MAQTKHLSLPIISCLLIVFVKVTWHSWQDIRKTHIMSLRLCFGPAVGTKPGPLAPLLLLSTLQAILYIVPDIWVSLYFFLFAHAMQHARVQLLVTPWTIACQAPLSMEFSRQEYWREWPFPTPGDFPAFQPVSLVSPAMSGRFFTTEPLGSP